MRRTRVLGASMGMLVLFGATGATALAVKPKAGTWTGTTSQSLPITSPALTFQVSSDGKMILNFEPAFTASCSQPGSPTVTSPVIVTDAGRNLPIKDSKFSAHATNGVIHSGSLKVATASDRVHGKFSSRHAAEGTYSVTFKANNNSLTRQAGIAGDTCKTGIVSWMATRS
jgi:hypothetical protein